ncbi:MAG TPA: fibronectin type III domain-containing protein [Deltaproteobacteria bacterium]|nr:fibronectin type III domain-containing protein [Deltaproteobacteria bacterium]
MKSHKLVWATLVILGILISSQAVYGATVRISWNANTEADLDGYKVYYGITSRSYLSYRDVGNTTSVDIGNLGEGQTHYFAVSAYDINGNESALSQECSVLIPVQEVPQDPVDDTGKDAEDADDDIADPGIVPLADSDMDGIPDNAEILWSLNPEDPYDSLYDDDGDGAVNLVEYMEGTDPLDPEERPVTDDVVKDLIAEVGEVVDLTAIGGSEALTFVPLTAGMPEVIDQTVVMGDPGAYLYNAYDADGNLVYRVRISITVQMYAMGSFGPGAPLNLNELVMGISLHIAGNAIPREVPVGIGGDVSSAAASAVDAPNAVEFDLLPYGLVLAQPATVSVEVEGVNPTVERYNDVTGDWEDIAVESSEGGLVTFSTQQFGTFRVSAEKEEGAMQAATSGSSGGGCFISSVCR